MNGKKKTRVIILGAGISGLALGWYLVQDPRIDLLILEKEQRAGGVLGAQNLEGFFFEKSARIFKRSRSKALLDLLQECGLESEVIQAGVDAQGRYLLRKNRLSRFPENPFAFLFSPITRSLLPALLTEWRKPCIEKEESIWEFATRRFGRSVAEKIFDPLVVGIYAGDIRRLSMSACFPEFKRLEQEFGSLTRALLKQEKQDGSLFSLRGGSEAIVQKLQENKTILFGLAAKGLFFSQKEVTIQTGARVFTADHVFSALPLPALKKLLPEVKIPPISFQSIATVNLGFEGRVLDLKGFGYLVPSNAGENMFGVVFDSNLFPQQNKRAQETRLTAMLPIGADYERETCEAIRRHLGIVEKPAIISVSEYPLSIPQLEVGHEERIKEMKKAIAPFLRLHLIGNYLSGPAVSDLIASAKETASKFCNAL